MRKFLKVIMIVFVLIVLVVGIYLFSIKGRISLYIDIAKKYIEFVENPPMTNGLKELNSMETMDYRDVIYKERDGTKLTLDIYGPKKILKYGSPVILYVHGGSWVYGDKNIPSLISPILDSFREQGFTIISTSYELMRGEEIFEKQVQDVKDTIRWIHKNKDVYGFNINEIGVLGVSSGAHLAMMATYTDDSEFKGDSVLADYSSKVKYVIDFFGPTDLNTLDMSRAGWDLEQVIKSAERSKDKEEVFSRFSPINYVKEGIPKTLIIHSKMDQVVPYENSTRLYDSLININQEAQLLTLESSGHDLSAITKDDVTNLVIQVLRFMVRNSSL